MLLKSCVFTQGLFIDVLVSALVFLLVAINGNYGHHLFFVAY